MANACAKLVEAPGEGDTAGNMPAAWFEEPPPLEPSTEGNIDATIGYGCCCCSLALVSVREAHAELRAGTRGGRRGDFTHLSAR